MDRSRQRIDAERRERNIAEYEKHDDSDMPGWTLLLPAVVKAYGVCPFLDVRIPQHGEERARWIASQADGGTLYHNEVGRLISSEDRERHRAWEEQALMRLQNLTDRLGTRGKVDVSQIISALRKERESRTKTKKDKARFLTILQEVDRAAKDANVNLVFYMELVDRWNMRHTVPDDAEIDPDFADLCEEIRTERSQLNNISGEKGRQKKQAYDSLCNLIDDGFRLSQQGRWCKRWFQLSAEQKEERIQVYSAGWASSNGFTAETGRRYCAFVLDALRSKSLSTTNIHWNIQAGVVESIDVSYDAQADAFAVEKGPKVKGEKRKAKTAPDRSTSMLDPGNQKINRLMLLFLVSSDVVEKEAAVTFVCKQMGPGQEASPETTRALFDKMAETILTHPFPESQLSR